MQQVVKVASIPKHLVEKINAIPAKPGIYQMKDSHGNIIYIGKSKTLKSRVRSYFNREHEWEKIKRMVLHIQDIDIIITDTHLEAQMLECELIKKIKPMYNAQFKNDQKYKCLKIENTFKNRLMVVTDQREDESCFGPYRSKSILLDVIKFFENIYPLSKTREGYEFTYNILPLSINRETFETNRNCLVEIFTVEEHMLTFLTDIENKMKTAAEDFRFETAVIYRDVLAHIKYLHYSNIRRKGDLNTRKILMGEKIEGGYKIFYISNGSIVLKKIYKRVTKEVVERFLIKARALEDRIRQIENEKSSLDFESIIYAEIKDETSKAVLMVGSTYNLEPFIRKLIKVDPSIMEHKGC